MPPRTVRGETETQPQDRVTGVGHVAASPTPTLDAAFTEMVHGTPGLRAAKICARADADSVADTVARPGELAWTT
jgi:hypothetical protein